MSNKTQGAHDATSASDARRHHADSIPRFQRLRALIRPEAEKRKYVRTGSSDWGADEAGSFCTPDPEEYTWNRQDLSEPVTKYGVVTGDPTTHHDGASDEKEHWENPIAATGVRFPPQAVLDSGYQSRSDEEGWMARRHRRLARAKRYILQLRDDLHRRARTRRWIEMGLGGDEDEGLLRDGIDDDESEDADDEVCEDSDEAGDDSHYQVSTNSDDEEGHDADDEGGGGSDSAERGDSSDEEVDSSKHTFVTAPMVIRSAERLLADAERLRESKSNGQGATRKTVSFGLCPKAQRSTNEERPVFGKLRARLQAWQRSVRDSVVGNVP
ncbi:MAG: hypothetical protein LQ347_000903 [Umbilicaria vellea]|nr:MAG: hypothetical protein LQ347_000903 [Umbilicaria vellea]